MKVSKSSFSKAKAENKSAPKASKPPEPKAEKTRDSSEKTSLSKESSSTDEPGGRVSDIMAGMAEWAGTENPSADATPDVADAGQEDVAEIGAADQTSSEPQLQLNESQALSRGSSSESVRQLQEILNQNGQQLEVDGIFGPRTEAAVRSFQEQSGLQVDGIVGPQTRGALNGGSSSAGAGQGTGTVPGNTSGQNPLEQDLGGAENQGVQDNPEIDPSNQGQTGPSGQVTTGDRLEGIPERERDALGGSAFLDSISHLQPGRERDQAVLQEILSGNVPENSRNLQQVTVNRDGREISYQVMPDYLSIGSNEDNVRIPMTPAVAQAIADRTGTSLPTDRIVDDIHSQARQLHLPTDGRTQSNMTSIGYYGRNDALVDDMIGSGTAQSQLVSGHRKDLVIPHRDGRVAIYGARWANGNRIQSYSNVHGDYYEDYSHGVRLVSQNVTIDGQSYRLADLLQDPSMRSLFTGQSGSFGY